MEEELSMEDEPAMLNLLAEKAMHAAVNPAHFVYCPTMDLIALSTIDNDVGVYRLNGQRVFGLLNKNTNCQVNRLKWKPSGQLLAVALSDHSIRLINAHTGKTVHNIDYSTHSSSAVCCLGWGISFTDVKGARSRVSKLNLPLTSENVLGSGLPALASDLFPNLPTDLARLDIEGALPRLSVLSAGGKGDDAFSSRASIDAIFHSSKKDSNDFADVLVTGFQDGMIHLSIYDFFEIGSFTLQRRSNHLELGRLLLHSSHPYFSTHSLLVSASFRMQDEICFLPLDLRLIPESGRYLSLLATKSTQMYNIIRYIQQLQTQLYSEFKASQDLPSKFIGNIEEALQEKAGCSWVHAAYHHVVTGNCYAPVKEWLVDELGERGHKRWDKAVFTGYENIRRLAHENLLPALERFSVLVSRLRGLSRYQNFGTTLGLSTQELDDVFDTVSCLQLLAHNIQTFAGIELSQFSAFSAWLRQEIEIQAVETTLASAEESAEKDSMLDHALILDYIQGPMLQSRLVELLNLQSEQDERPKWDLEAQGRSIYPVYRTEIKVLTDEKSVKNQLPGLDALVHRLGIQCNTIFNRIAKTQRENVKLGTPISLGIGGSTLMDMRVFHEEHLRKQTECVTYIAIAPARMSDTVLIYRIVLEIISGISSTTTTECSSVVAPTEHVKDIKFVDDKSLVLALSQKSSSRLLCLPYNKKTQDDDGLTYRLAPIRHDSLEEATNAILNDPEACLNLSDDMISQQFLRHIFPSGASWTPAALEINGRKGRRVLCALSEDKIHYRVYDVDRSFGNGNTED